jgi:hypothetical protein
MTPSLPRGRHRPSSEQSQSEAANHSSTWSARGAIFQYSRRNRTPCCAVRFGRNHRRPSPLLSPERLPRESLLGGPRPGKIFNARSGRCIRPGPGCGLVWPVRPFFCSGGHKIQLGIKGVELEEIAMGFAGRRTGPAITDFPIFEDQCARIVGT